MLEWIERLDTLLFFFLNSGCQNRPFDIIMPVITHRANIIVLPFLLFFLVKERKRALTVFAVSFFSILLSDALANALKGIIGRERPCNVLASVHLLVGCSRSFSFPSNHATNAFGFAIPFLLMSGNRLRYIFVFVAAMVGLSRIFVGVHYPFDVLIGTAVGSVSAIAVVSLYRLAEIRFRERPYTTVLYVFLFILSVFRIYFILYGPLDLSPDEAHYWEWSRRLGLSYYSKGPMIAYLIAAGTAIFGDNVFGVRALAVVFSLLSSLVLYKLGKEMFDEMVGTSSAILFQLIPLFSVFGVIFTIDSPFIFFWIVSLYLFWKAICNNVDCSKERHSRAMPAGRQEGGNPEAGAVKIENQNAKTLDARLRTSGMTNTWYWILLGVTVGFGLLTKYTMAFFYVCALVFFISSHRNRGILKTAFPYVSFVTSVIVFIPVIIWNVSHDWVTVRHTAGQAHVAEGLRVSFKSSAEFIGSQLGVLTPVIFALIIIALWKVKRDKVKAGGVDEGIKDFNDSGKGDFLFWFSIPVIVFFLLKSLQGKVQANWAMTGYITGIIAFSVTFLSGLKRHKPVLKIIVIVSIILSSVVTAIAHYPSKFHIPLRLDPSARLRGWEKLAKATDALYESINTKGKPFVFSDSYQISSELAFYMKGHPTTYCVNLGRRMNQYDLWPGFNGRMHSDAIFVTIGDAILPFRIQVAFGDHTKYLYKVYEKGKVLREYSLFVCRDFRGMKEEIIRSY